MFCNLGPLNGLEKEVWPDGTRAGTVEALLANLQPSNALVTAGPWVWLIFRAGPPGHVAAGGGFAQLQGARDGEVVRCLSKGKTLIEGPWMKFIFCLALSVGTMVYNPSWEFGWETKCAIRLKTWKVAWSCLAFRKCTLARAVRLKTWKVAWLAHLVLWLLKSCRYGTRYGFRDLQALKQQWQTAKVAPGLGKTVLPTLRSSLLAVA